MAPCAKLQAGVRIVRIFFLRSKIQFGNVEKCDFNMVLRCSCFPSGVILLKAETRERVAILGIKSSRFLCMDLEGNPFSSVSQCFISLWLIVVINSIDSLNWTFNVGILFLDLFNCMHLLRMYEPTKHSLTVIYSRIILSLLWTIRQYNSLYLTPKRIRTNLIFPWHLRGFKPSLFALLRTNFSAAALN